MASADRKGILVVGDVMLDILVEPAVEPAEVERLDLTDLDHAPARIGLQVGGTGVNIAVAAARSGFQPVRLVWGGGTSRRGDLLAEAAGSAASEELRTAGVEVVTGKAGERAPGMAVIVHSGAVRRAMFADAGPNSIPMTPEAVDEAIQALAGCGSIIISGYALFRGSSAEGARRLIAAARSAGMNVVLDLVPHSAYRSVSPEVFEAALAEVDYLSSEFSTLLAFHRKRIGRTGRTEDGDADPPAVIERLLRHVSGLLVVWRASRYVVVDRDGFLDEGSIEQPEAPATHTGLSDRLLVTTLRDHFLKG